MLRAFRDGYNRTNLTIGGMHSRWFEFAAWAVHEPWDGPAVGFMIRIGRRRFVRLVLSW